MSIFDTDMSDWMDAEHNKMLDIYHTDPEEYIDEYDAYCDDYEAEE